ncbi:MAG: formate dehydrogenase accessory sulfurtransferase FdhD [Polaribacter sp.]|uniref:formate dehydrogenase accessory sulfurtransferase FdhD n=1 Tax=Polaribacter sp. TaxID=1920175 RepID=UPI003266CB8C
MHTYIYQVIKINQNNQTTIEDVLVVEAPLQININNEPYTVVLRTPDNNKELIRGLLFAEDIYKSKRL